MPTSPDPQPPPLSRQPLHVLYIEDDPDDLVPLELALREAGFELNLRRVDSPEELDAALAKERWDVVVADFHVPGLSVFDALSACRAADPNGPFIVVSGAVGEERAAEVMRAGANDFLLKTHLRTRLGAVVERELRDAQKLRDRARAEERLRESEETFRLLVEGIPDYAIFMLDPEGRVTSWNRGARRVKGYETAEVLDQPFERFFAEEARAAGRPQQLLERAARNGQAMDEGWHVRKDGRRFWADVVLTALRGENDELRGFIDITRDITEWKNAERERERLHGELESEHTRLEAVLRQMRAGVVIAEAPSGRLVLGNRMVDKILRRPLGTSAGENLYAEWTGFRPDGRPYAPDEWPLARALKGETTDGEEIEILRGDDTRGAIVVSAAPIRNNAGEIVAAVASFTDITDRKQAEAERREALAREREARTQAEEAERRSSFLAEASAIFTSTLDYETTLQRVAELLVPRLADWCAIDVVDEEGSARRLAVAHVDPEKVRLASELNERYPPNPDAPGSVQSVVRSGQPYLLPEISDEMIAAGAQDEEHLAIIRSLGLRSAAVIPLIARRETLGTLSLIWAESGRRYTEADLRFTEELARRAAVAIDNARLFRSAQEEIAERERAEEALRSSEEQLSAIFHQAAVGIAQTDGAGRFVLVNQRFCELLDRPLEEVLRIGFTEVIHPDDLSRALNHFRQLLGSGQGYVIEFRFVRPDGSFVWANSSVSALLDAEGKPQFTVSVVQDVTDKKRVEELQRSNRELEQFAYVASHDLQEPLRKIRTFADRLATKYTDVLDDSARNYLERMQGAAGRMQSLIDDLLSFSRVTTQAQAFVQVDLERVVREVLSDLETRLEQTDGSVEVEPLPTIEADPLQMRQLLQNLIANGIKFHRPDVPPLVRVRAERIRSGRQKGGPEFFRLIVEDNGIGFEEQYVSRLFAPFKRLHNRDEYEGTGIGLAICRKIAERHGGGITARSTPGVGSNFIVTLPFRQERRENQPVQAAASEPEKP